MTEERAKEVIRSDPTGNIAERIEALEVAREVLGWDCTLEDIWEWVDNAQGESIFTQIQDT